MSLFGEKILLALSRDPNAPDHSGRTATYNLSNALDYANETIPNFAEIIRGKNILDYGCGPGWQAVAMYQSGARHVVGVDIDERWLTHARTLAGRQGLSRAVEFHQKIPDEQLGQFDLALSLSSFEHFSRPEKEIEAMREAVSPGGCVVISFAEPWYSHNGSHMSFFTKVPWVNLWFSEETIMRVRSKFRDDGAMRYEEVTGGLNKMTLKKFVDIVNRSKLRLEHLKFYPTKGLPLVDKIPVVRELLVSSATCILRKDVNVFDPKHAARMRPALTLN
jgi:2-polyprenyl-3-methyl-5-hydroxy-6-metoxy-1,4-benzoquinol methylase